MYKLLINCERVPGNWFGCLKMFVWRFEDLKVTWVTAWRYEDCLMDFESKMEGFLFLKCELWELFSIVHIYRDTIRWDVYVGMCILSLWELNQGKISRYSRDFPAIKGLDFGPRFSPWRDFGHSFQREAILVNTSLKDVISVLSMESRPKTLCS